MTPEDRRQLLIAEIEDLTAAVEHLGLWVKGSQGQDILNPALAARRAALEALRKLEAGMTLDEGPDALAAFLEGA
ncbi:MAG: hypothetical protein AB1679_14285 [Actinomycetota bacterium]|jgi:hypothetical protein